MKKHLLYSSILALTIPMLSHADAINVHVLSATIKDQNIANAEVILQKNGERSASSSSNSNGRATVNANTTDNADNLLIIKKSGYSTLVAKCPCDGMTYALSPVLKDLNSMRIVLNWGKNPSDLDSHLSYKNQHIYWDRKQGLEANLDVDDVDSYGPETVTIDRRLEGQYYVYSVHDFSDRGQPNTTNLSNSQAKVMVYTGESLIRSYYVPTGQTGNLWTVFRISPEGEIQDINRMSGTTVNASQVGSSVSNYQSQSTRVNIVPVSAAAQARAKTLNFNADKAYKNNQFEQASMLYQQSIDYNPNAGQTYSNLAVAYQKLNRSSEALWANQKAIALASNDNTRAYSHYNMGKIYENNQDFAQAKQHYQLANQYKPSPTYDEAIQRVSR
ncbi:YfaP family protein [Acinetobacter wuhouensis]|uniref:Tetratricopeptide repeat protein n=1 Tax=Acinetobacter wuhouensis TaxID=1879050 RepID=A0A4V2DN38_9GAMM|nr:tetratricopeptide repeat protein [Acinetobacter wuhouensis]RZG46431.1 tetratricopeptide repeat protein [Acinetobacter wuhouensis]